MIISMAANYSTTDLEAILEAGLEPGMEARLMASLDTYLKKKLDDSFKELRLSLRMEFLRFDGNNLHDWLSRCENYFIVRNIPDEHKVQLATSYLEGIALEWQ